MECVPVVVVLALPNKAILITFTPIRVKHYQGRLREDLHQLLNIMFGSVFCTVYL